MADSARQVSDLCLDGDAVRETGKKLGKGAYGEVVEVEYLGTLCAAKRIHSILEESGSHPEEGFRRECETWSQLRHPNVVQLLGLLYKPSSASKLPMIVMEKMDCSLRQFVEVNDRDRLPLSVKVDVLFQVAQGLTYLHGQRPPVVHRDLSPNNILISLASMTAKLSDFGVAKVFQLHQASKMTCLPGTPAFMPPETLPEAQPASKDYGDRIDVFSYGGIVICTLTHMWPEPVPSVVHKDGNLIALNEIERRQKYLNHFTAEEKTLFLVLVQRCLEFQPMDRLTSQEILMTLQNVRGTHRGQSYVHLLQSLHTAMKSNEEANELLQKKVEDLESLKLERADLQELNKKLQDENLVLSWEREEAVTKLQEAEENVILLHETIETLQGQIDEQDAMLSRMRNEYGHELLLEGPQVLQTEAEGTVMGYQETQSYGPVREDPTKRLIYDRVFLLSMRFLGVCLQPPTHLFLPGMMDLVGRKEMMQQPSKTQTAPKRTVNALCFVDPNTNKPLDLGGVASSSKSKSPEPTTLTSPTQDAKREEFMAKISERVPMQPQDHSGRV